MPEILLRAERPVASDSPDHLAPRGTRRDNSRNPLFNKKLYSLFEGARINVLDLGCAGGAFVRDCVEDGNLAVGLEGSDYCRKNGRGEWRSIAPHLFTCDITAEFFLELGDDAASGATPLKFDVVTAWEVMEHIPEQALPAVCRNVVRHLNKDGLWIMSVADFEDAVAGVHYHQTVRSRDWWLDFFKGEGFRHHPQLVDFFAADWIRGPYQSSDSFHLVLTHEGGQAPKIPAGPPYTVRDMVETGDLAIGQAVERGTAATLSLDYALRLFDDAKTRQPGYEGIDYRRALAYFYLGRLDEAAGAALAELDRHPDHAQARQLLDQLDRLREGKQIRGFDEFLVRYHRGVRWLGQGETDAARSELQRAHELRPEDETAAQRYREAIKPLVKQALAEQDPARALELLGRFPGILTEDREWHFLIAQARHLKRDAAQALQQYNLAQRLGYDEGSIRLQRGILLRELGDMAGSRADLERAVALRPRDRDARSHLEETLRRLPDKGVSVQAGGRPRGRPRFSIVTPAYNCARFLRGCIESVLAQGYENFEHIIVDGASTDGTQDILRAYPHLKWISEPDEGEAQALNKALARVGGDVIGWLNADDAYLPGAFHEVAAALEAAPDRHLVYGKALFIGEDGTPTHWVVPYAPLNLVTLTRWFRLNLFQPAIFFTSELYRDVGAFREDLDYGVDYEYWFRIAHKGYAFHYLDRVLAKAMIYRAGGKTETPYAVKAGEWLAICRSYLPRLGVGERIHFWKDYYEFRLRHHGNAFYYGDERIAIDEDPESVSGFALAARDLGMIHGNTIDPLLHSDMPDSANLLGVLGEHLHNHQRAAESAKAFEWALALESRDPAVRARFGLARPDAA